jgi:hypothetical protein
MPCFCLAYALLKARQKQGISKAKARHKQGISKAKARHKQGKSNSLNTKFLQKERHNSPE